MTAVVSNPNVRAALERAGMFPPDADVIELLTSACEHPEIESDGILEISRADWGNEEQSADDVLVVQTRAAVFVIVKGKGGLFKPATMARVRFLYEWYSDLAEDDEMAPAAVVFLANPGHKHFLLSFRSAEERHRMFRCLFEAHRGQFSRWGLQLDPTNYLTDFDRYYAEIVSSGPARAEGMYDWVKQQYGDFDRSSALGLAEAWRSAELRDDADPTRAARVGMMSGGDTWWRAELHPESRRVVVRLGEEIYDAGLLAPPYDERTFTDDALSHHDAGPRRLLALMTLAAFAHAIRDPRAQEWIDAARAGIGTVPASVFPDKARELWADIDSLPAEDDGPPPEIPIWEDLDVRQITAQRDDEAYGMYSLAMLSPSDRAVAAGFLDSVAEVQQDDSPTAEALTSACLCGVGAFEALSPLAPAGWRKLIVYIVSDLTYELWEKHRNATAAGRLAQWVIVTIEGNGWGPDGRSSPLGQHHSYAMGVAGGSGLGIVELDPQTGLYRAPTGDEARQAAADGHF